MAATKLSAVNQVLSEIGREPVTALTDTPDVEFIISPRLDLLYQELANLTDWNFLIKFVTLNTPNTVPFSPDFLYWYQLPSDYSRFDRLSWQTTNWGLFYRIIDGLFGTNMRPVLLYYISSIVDYTVITPVFQRALVLYCASDVCTGLTNDRLLTKDLELKYEKKLIDATRFNDMERMVQSTPYNEFDRNTYI